MKIWHVILVIAVIVAAFYLYKHRATLLSKLG